MIKIFNIDKTKYYFDTNSLELYRDESPEEECECNKEDLKENSLYTVTFLVTNKCNARCKYCYETPGNEKMDREAADRAISFIEKKYERIEKVCFFGGEPLLNFEIIKYITEYMDKKFEIGHFEITTNTILLNDEQIQFLCEHKFKVIVSFDGPVNIHDYLRIGCDYNKVFNNIRKLKRSLMRESLEINCTYTQYHEDNIGWEKLEEFFEELGVKYTLSKVITEKKEFKLINGYGIEAEKKDIDRSYENLAKDALNIGISRYVSTVINAIVQHSYSDKFCGELSAGMAFNVDGKCYPCTSLIGKCEMDDEKLDKCNSKENELCNKCWVKGFCFLCAASLYLGESKIENIQGECNFKELYEYSFLRLLHYYHYEPQKFQAIVDNYYK